MYMNVYVYIYIVIFCLSLFESTLLNFENIYIYLQNSTILLFLFGT